MRNDESSDPALHIEDVAIGEPGQLRRELLALALEAAMDIEKPLGKIWGSDGRSIDEVRPRGQR
jgi:hypothetical protein